MSIYDQISWKRVGMEFLIPVTFHMVERYFIQSLTWKYHPILPKTRNVIKTLRMGQLKQATYCIGLSAMLQGLSIVGRTKQGKRFSYLCNGGSVLLFGYLFITEKIHILFGSGILGIQLLIANVRISRTFGTQDMSLHNREKGLPQSDPKQEAKNYLDSVLKPRIEEFLNQETCCKSNGSIDLCKELIGVCKTFFDCLRKIDREYSEAFNPHNEIVKDLINYWVDLIRRMPPNPEEDYAINFVECLNEHHYPLGDKARGYCNDNILKDENFNKWYSENWVYLTEKWSLLDMMPNQWMQLKEDDLKNKLDKLKNNLKNKLSPDDLVKKLLDIINVFLIIENKVGGHFCKSYEKFYRNVLLLLSKSNMST